MDLETTHSPELFEELLKYSSKENLDKFFDKLYSSYGDGQVLTDKQIIPFIKSGLHKSENDLLGAYVDTVRMIRMVNDEKYKTGIDYSAICSSEEILINVHDELVANHKQVFDEKVAEKYLDAMVPFQKFLKEDCGKITIELIATLAELNHEGTFMNHCIATYFDIIANKQYVGFRVTNNDKEERLTLGCIRHNGELYFNQLKGWGNHPASKESCLETIEFCKKHHIIITEEHVHDLMPAFL